MVILDLILTPSDSSFISNVTVSDLVLDHALEKFHPDFACPVVRKLTVLLSDPVPISF